MKKNKVKNGIAKDLRTPKYKLQVQKDKKRKSIIKSFEKMIVDFFKGL